ncbi:DUF1878 family protein [Siminovitchia fortis]|uniref:DUF1878 family protein n=1 Tax=Siminovitchia fortis TaxID=254758 RepID=A0A443J2C6_9BACI|nr:DUF1878 family protein [Siminovitchia fortis]RWR14592.1 DUF1878 family protein [Siminovitchia fortis]WHY80272.1 DUF1878 family protein [Siminovitchia fortis]
MDELYERILLLEYHQKLLLDMIQPVNKDFDLLIIKKRLAEKEVEEFFQLCEELSAEMEKQKAEKFVFHFPLFKQFTSKLNGKLQPEETIQACLKQNIYPELMKVLRLNIK